MSMVEPSTSLFVKNVPQIPHSALEELFMHYGAKKSISLASGSVWILEFENCVQSTSALNSLHNLQVHCFYRTNEKYIVRSTN